MFASLLVPMVAAGGDAAVVHGRAADFKAVRIPAELAYADTDVDLDSKDAREPSLPQGNF